jgi:hypothetical protein
VTIVAFPLDAVAGAPSYTGEMLRQTRSVLYGAAPTGRPLGALSGVRGGTPNATVTATTTTWTIKPHSGLLDLETAVSAGAYEYAVRTNETGAMTAANSTNDRIDLISLTLNDPAEGDGSSVPGVVATYTTGLAAASPTVPATPARSMALAQISVPKSGTGSPSVTWVAPTTPASGALTPVASSATYPNAPFNGQSVYNQALDVVSIYDGTQWRNYSPLIAKQVLKSAATNVTTGGSGVDLTAGWTATGGFDVGGITYTAGTLIAPIAGVYEIEWALRWSAAAGGTNWVAEITPTVNGAGNDPSRSSQFVAAAFASSLLYMSGSGKVQLNAGDAVGLNAFQSSGGTIQITEGSFGLSLVGATG